LPVVPSPSTASLVARGLTVERSSNLVLDGVDLTIGPGSRIGVVGPNGAGKSTLLQALAGLIDLDGGSVERTPPGATVGYLAQELDRPAGETVAALVERRTGLAAADAELAAASEALAAGGAGADERYSTALDQWLALGAADAEARRGEVFAELGIDEGLLGQPVASLSGGEGARVGLAVVLLSRFDVLLLDEPTNDLDFDGLARLEAFVAGSSGVAIVSHDRAFLERTVTSVFELDDHSHRGRLFQGGWLAYLAERETARRHASEAYEQYRDERAALTERARRQREWSVTGVRNAKAKATDNDKFIPHLRSQTSEKLAAKAKASERAIERLEVVEKPWEGWELRLELASTARAGDVVARLGGAVVERGGFRLGPVDLEVGWGERVALVGPNGAGKSTLLSALLGRVPLVAGSWWFGPGVAVGELDQARSRFTGGGALRDAFVEAAGPALGPSPMSEARSLLAKFGLGAEEVVRSAEELSPGERTRAGLALLMAAGANCLVLDEPTNHLDLPAIEQLESALGTWEGTLLLVTHDRRFLEAVRVDRTVEIRDGQVTS
jgi:ATPase subunit of ABC transporter with duplicated ATPase domains